MSAIDGDSLPSNELLAIAMATASSATSPVPQIDPGRQEDAPSVGFPGSGSDHSRSPSTDKSNDDAHCQEPAQARPKQAAKTKKSTSKKKPSKPTAVQARSQSQTPALPWEKPTATPTLRSPPAPPSVDPELYISLNPNRVTWIKVAIDFLQEFKEGGDGWKRLLALWVRLEDSQDTATPKGLLTRGRPSQVSWWIGRARPNKNPPIADVAAFVKEWWVWWSHINPEWRKRDESGCLEAGGRGPGKGWFVPAPTVCTASWHVLNGGGPMSRTTIGRQL